MGDRRRFHRRPRGIAVPSRRFETILKSITAPLCMASPLRSYYIARPKPPNGLNCTNCIMTRISSSVGLLFQNVNLIKTDNFSDTTPILKLSSQCASLTNTIYSITQKYFAQFIKILSKTGFMNFSTIRSFIYFFFYDCLVKLQNLF